MDEGELPWVFSGAVWQVPDDTNLYNDEPDEQVLFNQYPRWRWPKDRMAETIELAGCACASDIIQRSPAPRPLVRDEL